MGHERPNDRRGFIHKKLIGAVGGFLSGGPTGAISGFVTGGRKSPGRFPISSFGPGQCPPGTPGCPPSLRGPVQQPTSGIRGFIERALPFGRTGFEDVPFGDAVVGQFGAGLEPAVYESTTRRCPRGAVLATDGLCYNRRDISNRNRMWPRGRRPLLTGGDMRCITIAARAGRRLETKTKQLRRMGMMKALPRPRKGKTVLIESGAGSIVT